jgi:alpha-tubulin suppressor-like RCC1 family protein
VAVTVGGRVCTWGTWSHGRLGLGPTPLISVSANRRSTFGSFLAANQEDNQTNGAGSKLARYQLRPAFIPNISGAISVACGEAHCICILESGELYSWGQNSCGQLGSGASKAGFLRDEVYPIKINLLPSSTSRGTSSGLNRSNKDDLIAVKAQRVFAGSYHSVVIDEEGRAYTWGARGSPCLGQGECLSLEGGWSDKVNAVFVATILANKCFYFSCLLLMPYWTSLCVLRRICRQEWFI